ncbi:HD domain-containing protein [Streptomyces iconiensis]|uniref:ATP-binding protein n=1 Tax=Streptomyces iconiensis TaxID=1384038 RepID=A0ABT7A8W0_9ACTN|nr:ATP-binding protein [Streptomyces iconiensis]MDJ1137791.1 ATP-binding protein [Streptomyces iconiensis]
MEQNGSHNVYAGQAPADTVIQARDIEHLTVNGADPRTAAAHTVGDPYAGQDMWVRAAAGSRVWGHVRGGADAGAEHRRLAAAVTGRLAGLRDGLEPTLSADPWSDPGLGARFLERVEWLLSAPLSAPSDGAPLDLYPAEAALLVLTPFLYRVHYLRRAVELSAVGPASLRHAEERRTGAPSTGAPSADEPGAEELRGDRQAFEVFAEGDSALVQRALRAPEAEGAVGWWLFHRWLVQDREFADPRSVQALLDELGEPATALGGALDARRVASLLHGLRRGPDVCHPEFLGLLTADDRVRCGPGPQRIRDQRLVLLTALAYAASAELAVLPGIVAEHLGIPHPVDLAQLRATVERAHWGGSHELPVLRAECHHEAVIEALREHTARTDELLHAVRRTVRERITEPMPALPARLSADGVTAAEGAFDGYARFRTDGRRVRDLAMGIELYKDRDLAVRELYQNALDACRYRRARSEYLDRTDPAPGPGAAPYEGRIALSQGVDEDGRAYLECRDNGIGMGEEELRGVFAHAGARFAEQLEFRLERAQWEALDPPVTLYPNSRFGIGVLSYFMLADEITVTTCRMGPDGAPGPRYEIAICGPGHLFRIVRAAPRGREPGTCVRLYLRPDVVPAEWSCVDVLERVLAIAEFATSASEGPRVAEWAPGELKVRSAPYRETFGYNAHGETLPWPEAPGGVQVVWVEHGGALLVDGLYVEPTVRGGVLGADGSGLTGAVVNLRGDWSPAQLSSDRRSILDDTTGVVGELLERAAVALTRNGDKLLGIQWLCTVADGSMPLADLVASALAADGRELPQGRIRFGTPRTGLFPADVSLVPWDTPPKVRVRYSSSAHVRGYAPDHIYLWRVLAHGPGTALRELAELCPDLAMTDPVRRATPSDQILLQDGDGVGDRWRITPPHLGAIAKIAARLRRDPREIAAQYFGLGFHGTDPGRWSEDVQLTAANSRVFSRHPNAPMDTGTPLTANGLTRAATRAGTDVTTTAGFLRGLGFQVPAAVLALCVAAEEDKLLWRVTGEPGFGFLDPEGVVPLGHLARASLDWGLTVPEVRHRLAAYGLRSDPGALPERPGEDIALLLSVDADREWPWLDRARCAPPGQVLDVAGQLGCTPPEVSARLRDLGFTPPVLPADVHEDDPDLLTGEEEEVGVYLAPEDPVSYSDVFGSATEPSALRRNVGRLRAYGFDIPLTVPARPTGLDRELLDRSGPFPWGRLTTRDTVPFSYALITARELGTTPSTVARRLGAYGLKTSHQRLPEGLSSGEALKLLGTYDLDMEDGLPEASNFPLQALHEAARQRGTTLARVACWLQQLGIPVPDPADTIRAALERVPRPPQEPGPPPHH